MNIQDRDKHKKNIMKGQQQVRLQLQSFQPHLSHSVPKHKITINENNETNSQHIDQLNDSFSLDEESSTYGRSYIEKLAMHILDIFGLNPEAEGVEEEVTDEVTEEEDNETENKGNLNQQIEGHILMGILKDWKANCKYFNTYTKDRYEVKIKQFIEFLVNKEVSNPTKENAKEFLEYIIATTKLDDQKTYLWAMEAFFKWTGTEGKYENIVNGLKISRYSDSIRNENWGRVVDATEIERHIKLLRSSLRAWIKQLNKDPETKTQYRYEVLTLILFLNSRDIEKPTYNDIIDYYNLGRTEKNAEAKAQGLKIIRQFFYWAYKHNQYPENILSNDDISPQ